MAKVLLLNGSPRANGCTARELEEMIDVFEKEGIETEPFHSRNGKQCFHQLPRWEVIKDKLLVPRKRDTSRPLDTFWCKYAPQKSRIK